MKSILFFTLLNISLQAHSYGLVPKKVAEDVYCFFGLTEEITKENAGNIVNTCFVYTKEGFVVIDSGPTFAYASQAYTQMQKIAKLPVKYVINTHDHDDHWLGSSFYKSKNAFLIGPRTYEQNIVAGMQTRMHRILGDALYEKTFIVKLDTIVDGNLTLKVGDKHFEIKKLVKQAHTKGDLIVYIPETKVVFAGDLVFNDRITSLRDGSIIGSIEALKHIDALHPKVVIGGHGYKTDANATKMLGKYLTEMKKEILKALDDDISIEQITTRVKIPEFKDINLYDVLHKRNVFEAYRELEMYEEGEE